MSAPHEGLKSRLRPLLPTNLSLPCHLRLTTAIVTPVTFPVVLTFHVKVAPQFHSFRAHSRLKRTSKLMLLLLHGVGAQKWA